MSELSEFLLKRRSVVVRNMAEPGPSSDDLESIMRAGMRVPDHGRLTPWRFIVIRGDAREKMGKILGEASAKQTRTALMSRSRLRKSALPARRP